MYGETNQGRMRRLAGLGAVALAAVAVTGCAHNDVLVFGTSTTIGANLETSGGQGAPSILIGFERQEAVWMPLLANGVESQIAACRAVDGRTCPTPAAARTGSPSESMYQSTVRENGTVVRTESYSVFASLGASFNGRANTGVEAGAGLAQFFATGNAALNISENEALMTALKVSSPDSSRAQAEAIGYAAALTAEDRARIDGERAQQATDLTFVLQCAAQPGKDWAAMVNASTLRADIRGVIAALPVAQREPTLRGQDHWITPLAASAVSAGCQR